MLVLGAAIEADIAELEDHEERAMFLDDLGLDEPGVAKLIRSAYDLLDLQTYFTAGEKEVRAWTIRKGYNAPIGGCDYTDFEKGFIRAEVMKVQRLCGPWQRTSGEGSRQIERGREGVRGGRRRHHALPIQRLMLGEVLVRRVLGACAFMACCWPQVFGQSSRIHVGDMPEEVAVVMAGQ